MIWDKAVSSPTFVASICMIPFWFTVLKKVRTEKKKKSKKTRQVKMKETNNLKGGKEQETFHKRFFCLLRLDFFVRFFYYFVFLSVIFTFLWTYFSFFSFYSSLHFFIVELKYLPMTGSPSFFFTGILSPVIIDSFTELLPKITLP